MNSGIRRSRARFDVDAASGIFPPGRVFSPVAWAKWGMLLWQRLTIGPEWEFHYAVKAVMAQDGTPLLGQIMRRRIGDAVQYRRLTPDEEWEIGWD